MKPRRGIIQGNDTVRKAFERKPELDAWTLERDGALPLQFEGRKVGSGVRSRKDAKGNRGTEVNLYLTKSGKLVAEVYQWQELAHKSRRRRCASAFKEPEAALAWLIQDGGGTLGAASKQAWLEACASCEVLAKYGAETV